MENELENITQENDEIESESAEEIIAEIDGETSETTPETTPEENVSDGQNNIEVEDLKKKLATAEAQKDHWKKKAKVSKDKTVAELSSKDLYAMIDSKVPQEDVDEVVRASKALGISIPEALKSNIVKSILSDSADKRKTADVTNTENVRMGQTKTTDDELLANAKKGELPENDADIERLIVAQSKIH